jgi:hypothetical protein
VTDPKGVKLARVYFKTPARGRLRLRADDLGGGARYVATVPAINASAPSLQYVLLAVNSEGAVSKTQEYTAAARRTTEVPALAERLQHGRDEGVHRGGDRAAIGRRFCRFDRHGRR